MKTTQSLKERKLEESSQQITADLSAIQGREPGRAAMLSLIPGLGQIYNGERVKGTLFLAVTAANVLLLTLLFFTEPLLNLLIQIGAALHADSRINVGQALEIIHTGRAVTLVYLALIVSFVLYAARDAYDRAVEKRRGNAPPRFKLTMPEATSGSYLFHFSVICALVLMVIFVVAPPPPQVQTTNIQLLKEADPPPKAPEPPKPKQEVPKLAPKKVEVPKKVAPTPPKPTPVAFAVKTDQPVADPVVVSDQPAPPVQETAGSPEGSPTGTGDPNAGAGGGGDDVDFGGYLDEVKKRIKKNWFPPRGAESLTVTIKFKVMANGSVSSIRLVRSSGVAAADDAAKIAITNSAPFPPLPGGAPDVDIKFAFDYNVFNGKGL